MARSTGASQPSAMERAHPGQDPTLYRLTFLALLLAIGHHVDHALRGNAVGWPLTSEVNAFTMSLVIYPIIATGLVLYRVGRVGPGFWAFVSGGGLLFLAALHLGPTAVEPPSLILQGYEAPVLGVVAFAWLLGLLGVLAVTFIYELRQWLRGRTRSAPT